MANSSRPMGAVPKGAPIRSNPYTAGGTINIGDCLSLNASGQVVVATAAAALCGVAASYATSGNSVLVWDHPDQYFVMQVNSATVAALTDLNLNYDIVAGAATNRVSGHQIAGATQAVTATLPIKVLALSTEANNAYGLYARVICKINNHQFAASTGTTGV